MKVKKWIELSDEIEVQIGADDVRCALAEAFARVTVQNLDDRPNRFDISDAINGIGIFLNGLTDEHILLLSQAARQTVARFLSQQAERFGKAEKRAIEREDEV